jgi:broad specificity phosphatase PhoE
VAETERILVLIRHGQTDWNIEERFQGQLDIPLNAAGLAQADALKQRLTAIRFDVVYSSPLSRALETARIVGGPAPVFADARLSEIHHGFWQGKTKRDIAERWPDEWRQWNTQPERFTPPGAESAESVRRRVADFIGTIDGRNVLCVTHGVVIQTFLAILLGGPYNKHESYVPGNGSVHMLHFRDNVVCDYEIVETTDWRTTGGGKDVVR